jgi:GntR family transcriptional regulator
MSIEATASQHWAIEFNSGIPVYKQIINHVCAALASGTLKEGDQLPTLRQLHEQLEINPNTVAKAYRELELKGIIASERGSGSFVTGNVQAARAPEAEKQERVQSFYQRMLAEAGSCGITEEDLLNYINQRVKL